MRQFFNYFKALNYAPKPKSFQIIPIIASIIIIYLNIIPSILSDNIWAVLLSMLCAFAFLAGIILNNYFSSSPNVHSLLPISSKKSLAYRFLSVLTMFALMVIAALAILALITLITFLFSLIPSCNGGAEIPDEEITSVEMKYYPIGLYGGLFTVAYLIIMYASSIIIGLFKGRKSRNIFTVCFLAGLFVSFMETITASDFKSPFVNICFEAMALPWLCITYWFVAAAAMLGTAIYMGIKRYNPKKF